MLCNKACHKQGQRSNYNNYKCNFYINRQHKAQCSQNRQHPGKKLGKAHEQAVRKLVYIGDNTADDFTVGVSVNIF